MDNDLLKYILDSIDKDIDLKDFYEEHYYQHINISFNDYVKDICIDNENIFKTNPDEARKKILRAYINTRTRLNSKAKFTDRLIYYPLASEAKKSTIKSIVDNELKLLIINNVKSFVKTLPKEVERPLTLEGMYTTNEVTTLFDAENPLDVPKDLKAYRSEEVLERNAGKIQTVFIKDSNTEVIVIKKGEKSYLKSKSMDLKDMQIMDFLIEEYRNTMYYENQDLVYPIHKISKLIYNKKDKKYLDLTRDRLVKIGCSGQLVVEEEMLDKTDSKGRLINPKDNVELIRYFEAKFFTDSEGVRYCRISMSRAIERDLKTSNTIKLYRHEIEQIEDKFASVFVTYVQSHRVPCLIRNEFEITIPYKVIKINMMLPNPRSKAKNLAAIKNALQELLRLNIMIDDFEVTSSTIRMHFLPFSYAELKQLRLEDKAKELEINI